MKLAILTAMAAETLPILNKIGRVTSEQTIASVKIYQIETERHTVFLATCGVGEIRAAMAVQLLVDLFRVEAVLNFGFVGALNPNLEIGELVLAEKVCHYQFDTTAIDATKIGQYENKPDEFFYLNKTLLHHVQAAVKFQLKTVTVASGDKFVATAADKAFLKSTFHADICEMELGGIAIACERNCVPLISVKVVSDKADEQATVSFADVVAKGLTRYEEILPEIFAALDSLPQGSIAP